MAFIAWLSPLHRFSASAFILDEGNTWLCTSPRYPFTWLCKEQFHAQQKGAQKHKILLIDYAPTD